MAARDGPAMMQSFWLILATLILALLPGLAFEAAGCKHTDEEEASR